MSEDNGTNGSGQVERIGDWDVHPEKIDGRSITHQADWDAYHALILDAYVKIFSDTKRPPTQTEIAKQTGLSRQTVNKHFKSIKLQDELPSIKARTGRVLAGLAGRAEHGYAAEVSLFMQLVHDWVPRKKVEHSGSIDLNDVDVTKLPTDVLIRLREARKRGESIESILQSTRN